MIRLAPSQFIFKANFVHTEQTGSNFITHQFTHNAPSSIELKSRAWTTLSSGAILKIGTEFILSNPSLNFLGGLVTLREAANQNIGNIYLSRFGFGQASYNCTIVFES